MTDSLPKQWIDRLVNCPLIAVLVVVTVTIGGVASVMKNSSDIIEIIASLYTSESTGGDESKLAQLEWWVYFNFDQSSLSAGAMAELEEIAPTLRSKLNKNQNFFILVEGHAQEEMPEDKHLNLQQFLEMQEISAKKRAESVKSYLVSHAEIPNARIFVTGGAIPVVEGNTRQVNAMNRSVRISVGRSGK